MNATPILPALTSYAAALTAPWARLSIEAPVLAALAGLALRGALVLAAALLLARCLRLRRASAAAQHLVLAVGMCTLLLLPALSALLPAWELVPPVPPELAPSYLAGAAPDQGVAGRAARSASALLPGAAGPAQHRRSATGAPLAPLALGLWGLGLALCLARILSGLLGVRRLLRRTAPAAAALTGALGDLAGRAGIGAPPALLQIDAPISPLCAGLLRPAIVLPRSAQDWPAERLRLVLLHELGHARRRDCLSQFVAQLASALHWFNPLAWYAARCMRALREAAADDLVLTTGARATDYAGHLLDLAQRLRAPLPDAVYAALGQSPLEQRIRALLSAGHSHQPLRAAPAVWLGALALALLAPLASVGAQHQPDGPIRASATGEGPLSALSARYLRERGLALQQGHRLELTLDSALQAIAAAETEEIMRRWRPQAAHVIILDPRSGELRALAAQGPAGAQPELGVTAAYQPGSTIKPLVIAAALEQGAIRADQTLPTDKGPVVFGGAAIRDVEPSAAPLSVAEVLMRSSNIGAARIGLALGAAPLSAWVARFRLGVLPAVELPGAAAGLVPSGAGALWDGPHVAGVACGHGLAASPLQMAAAFAVLAGGGVYRDPGLVRRVVAADGAVLFTPERRAERLLRPEIAGQVLHMLEGVVHDRRGTGQRAAIAGFRVAGKTGTASTLLPDGRYAEDRYYASFIGAVPAEAPLLVILIGVDQPQGESAGGVVAAPSFRRVGEQALAYLGAAPAR